jgi:hypothetical protein
MPVDREHTAGVRNLRKDATRARRLARQVTMSSDRVTLERLADRWDQQADILEKTVNDDT